MCPSGGQFFEIENEDIAIQLRTQSLSGPTALPLGG